MPAEQSQALAKLAARSMQLQISIQDGSVYVSTADVSVEIHPVHLKTATA
ncbi:YaeQ family protein [Acinetobacter baumannii]